MTAPDDTDTTNPVAAWRAAVDAQVDNPTIWQVAQIIAAAAETRNATDPHGPLRIPVATFVDTLGVTVRRADRAVAALEDNGLIAVHADDIGYLLALQIPKGTHHDR